MTDYEPTFTPEEILYIKFRARVALARRYAREKRILDWGKMVFPEKFKLPFCDDLHGYFVEIRSEPFSVTEAPRGHAKTAIKCVLIPQFQALYEPERFRHYLNVQATELKGVDLNRGIKMDFEKNPVLQALHGNMIGERWTDHQFVLSNGVIFTALGAGQSIRGLNYRQVRPDYGIIDDLYDESEIHSHEATEKKNLWFWGSLFQAMAAGKQTSLHVQGTAINKSDILETLKTKPRWKSKTFKALIDEEKGVSLWPAKKSVADLLGDREDMGTVIFNREMQNERRADEESIIKLAWLAAWEYDTWELERILREGKEISLAAVLIGNDPSIGKDQEADENAAALILKTRSFDGKTKGYDYWIEGLYASRISLEERKNLLVSIAKGRADNRRVSKVRIEAIAGFDDYATYVTKFTDLPVERISHVKDKISTLESKSHFFENGKVHLNRNIETKLKAKLIEQLTTNEPKHDDVRDAVLLCLDNTGGAWTFL